MKASWSFSKLADVVVKGSSDAGSFGLTLRGTAKGRKLPPTFPKMMVSKGGKEPFAAVTTKVC